jgi:hypothetical protein
MKKKMELDRLRGVFQPPPPHAPGSASSSSLSTHVRSGSGCVLDSVPTSRAQTGTQTDPLVVESGSSRHASTPATASFAAMVLPPSPTSISLLSSTSQARTGFSESPAPTLADSSALRAIFALRLPPPASPQHSLYAIVRVS